MSHKTLTLRTPSNIFINIMAPEELKTHKDKLEKERALLVAELRQNEKPTDFGSDIDHFDEETDEAEELGNKLAVMQDLKDRLGEIDIALEKVRVGKYGACENCGKEISGEILNIDPESRFCKNCKK